MHRPIFLPSGPSISWDDYERKLQRNLNLLNQPKLLSLTTDEPLTEANSLGSILDKYQEVLDVSCRMLCKFMRLFRACISTFKVIQYQRTLMSKFSDKETGLAFDLQIGSVGDQVWGYYSWLHHLPAHYMNTWEEMMVVEFLMLLTHLFHCEAGPLHTRYLALQAASNTADYQQANLTLEQRAR